MTNLANYQLVHPELLTEETLLQVLRDRCVEIPRLESSDKTELVEIFKRVALPLPQRKYNDETHLGRKLISLRKSKEQREAASLDIASRLNDTESSNNCNRLQPLLVGLGTDSKKIRLSKPPSTPSASCDDNKRKSGETLPERPGCNKRRKITWP